jgi:UDP-N-acetylmuramoyl-tripeptide--D-alanyl-D-alanine ligase
MIFVFSFILICSVLVSLLYSLKQIYQLQVTEYRIDRFKSMLNDAGVSSFLMPKILFPAKTKRNFLILAVSFVTLVLFNILFLNLTLNSGFFLFLFVILNYILAKFFVVFASMLTNPIAQRVRDKEIEKAVEMVKNSKTTFIGVTGSFGKSSVKELLCYILKKKYSVERTGGNRNTDIGVALDVQKKLTEKLDFFVCEMGAYKIGEIKDICEIVKPKYGILCGIGNQHIDLFGSMENLVKAKSELLQALPEDGIGVVNIDNAYKKQLVKDLDAKVLSYGIDKEADFRLVHISYKKQHMFVRFSFEGKEYEFSTTLFGKHNALNLIGVVALALELKVSYEDIKKAISEIEPLDAKLSLHSGLNDSVVLNDGYNSNLHGFLAALEVMSRFEAKNKLAISHGILELGEEKIRSYREIVKYLEEYNIMLLTLDKVFLRYGSKYVVFLSSEDEILQYLQQELKEKDLLLVEGRFSPAFIQSLKLQKYGV